MPKFITPTRIDPTTGTGWLIIDLTSQFGADSGQVAGVFLVIENVNSTTERIWNLRKYAGTGVESNSITLVSEDKGGCFFAVGVDPSNRFELYRNSVDVHCWIEGYCLNSEAVFFDAPTADLGLAATGSWESYDLSAHTVGNENLLMAFYYVVNNGAAYDLFGSAPDGMGDAEVNYDIYNGDLQGGCVACITNIADFYRETANMDVYMIGYLKNNFTLISPREDISQTATGAQTKDLTALIAANAVGIYAITSSNTIEYSQAFWNNAYSGGYLTWADSKGYAGICGVDANKVIGQYAENLAVDLFLYGYFTEPVVAGDLSISVHDCSQIVGAVV